MKMANARVVTSKIVDTAEQENKIFVKNVEKDLLKEMMENAYVKIRNKS